MKNLKYLTAILLASAFLAGPAIIWAGEAQPAKPKPYPLETCVVTGEKLGGMGKPYVFTHEGREIKLCCKGCLKAFNKEPGKYVKQLEEAEKKAQQSSPAKK